MNAKVTGASVRLTNTASVTRADVDALRQRWPHTLIVKGLLSANDALQAERHGADGVVLSNHGGRNLDPAVAPIEVLPEVRAALSSRTTLIVDTGIRRGSDIEGAGARCGRGDDRQGSAVRTRGRRRAMCEPRDRISARRT